MYKSKQKKALALLLTALLLLAAFAGCSKQGLQPSTASSGANESSGVQSQESRSSEEEPEPPVTITLTSLGFSFWEDDYNNTVKGTAIYDEILEKTNVDFRVEGFDGEQSQIRIASKELGDIIQIIGSADDLNVLYTNEQIIPLNDLVDRYAPHIRDDFPGRWDWACNAVNAEPGVAYVLPVNCGNSGYNSYPDRQLFIVRWDLYKQLDYPKITDEDSYLDVLEQMLELQPQTADGRRVYGVSFLPGAGLGISQCFQATYGYFDKLGGHISERLSDGSLCYEYTAEDSPLWRGLEFFNKAYRRGLLDPDCFTHSTEDYNAKVATGQILVSNTDPATNMSFAQNMYAADPSSEAVLVALPVEGTYVYQNLNSNGWGLAFCMAINSKCERPDAAMRLLGYLFSYEGSRLGWSGAQGVDWEYNDDGVAVFTDRFYEEAAKLDAEPPYSGPTCLANWVGIQGGTITPDGSPVGLRYGNDYIEKQPMLPGFVDFCRYYNVDYPVEVLKNAVANGSMAGDLTKASGLALSESTEDIARIEEALDNYFREIYPNAITAADEAAFKAVKASMIEAMNKLGAETAREYWEADWARVKERAGK